MTIIRRSKRFVGQEMMTCSHCERLVPLTCFRADARNTTTGKQSRCKRCEEGDRFGHPAPEPAVIHKPAPPLDAPLPPPPARGGVPVLRQHSWPARYRRDI